MAPTGLEPVPRPPGGTGGHRVPRSWKPAVSGHGSWRNLDRRIKVGGPNGTRTRAAALKERKGGFSGTLIAIRTHSPGVVKLNAGAGSRRLRSGLIGERGSDGFAAIHIVGWDERWDARIRQFRRLPLSAFRRAPGSNDDEHDATGVMAFAVFQSEVNCPACPDQLRHPKV